MMATMDPKEDVKDAEVITTTTRKFKEVANRLQEGEAEQFE